MKNLFCLLAILGLMACEERPAVPAAPAPIRNAAPATQFGHISPIRLPPGEFFTGFYITPEVWAGSSGGTHKEAPERYWFSTATNPPKTFTGTHILRDSQGVPVLIVVDERP